MRAAGVEVLECYRVLANAHLNLIGEVLRGERAFRARTHYPKGEVFDPASHSLYYYHAHGGLPGEHGHFHTFLRPPGMPKTIQRIIPPQSQGPAVGSGEAHLVAISMDAHGLPVGIFTTPWAWYPAPDVLAMLGRFEIDHAAPSWVANRWITAMLKLFRPDIEELVRRRDVVVARWRKLHPRQDPARSLQIVTKRRISVNARIATVNRALG